MPAARVPRRIPNIAPAKPLLSGLLAPLAALGILLLGPLDAAGQQTPPLGPQTIEFAFPDLSFSRMTHLTHAGDGTDRLWVVLQRGLIEVFPNDPEVAQAGTFLDIRDQVRTVGDEEGLLGLAFDPGYADNGYFYAYYSASNPRRSVISRFSVGQSDPDQADPASELVLLEVAQPFSNHNGGNIVFGPDGYMYVGLGDGGSGGDPLGNGQDTSTLLGTVLRIDVRGATETTPYRVPPDNPLVDTVGARDEIWAYGLRNPWKFSFDPATDALWLADVGQDRYEEIHLVQPGQNYGWNVMEGAHCYLPRTGCDQTGLELPVFEYDHDEGCSITGGYVYRGARLPGLAGAYLYADFCSGFIWGLRHDGAAVTDQALLVDSALLIPSFGVDEAGEVYILAFDGRIYRFVAEEAATPTPTATSTATPASSDTPTAMPTATAIIIVTPTVTPTSTPANQVPTPTPDTPSPTLTPTVPTATPTLATTTAAPTTTLTAPTAEDTPGSGAANLALFLLAAVVVLGGGGFMFIRSRV